MAKTKEIKKVSFATDPIGKLIVRFAIPCVIALVVNALYNIVGQIFIGWGADISATVRRISYSRSPLLHWHLRFWSGMAGRHTWA